MRIITDGRGAPTRTVLALGMFDGVHLGHRVLIKKARHIADERELPLVAVSFARHPLSVIAPESCPPCLTTPEERAALLEELGVDVLYLWKFDRDMMLMPPENYVGELVRRFHPTDVVCGYNHSYGRGGAGTPRFMEAIGGALGFRTVIVPRITLGGREVSSTAIRALIGKGDAQTAMRLLGRPYTLRAEVARREGRAPELRLNGFGKQMPPSGRYRALLEPDGENARLPVSLVIASGGAAECEALPERVTCGGGTVYLLRRAWG